MPKIDVPRSPSLRRLADIKINPETHRDDPVWEGPCSDEPQGGVTSSLLGRYLCDKERFRLTVIEGWKPSDRFNHRLEYGTMWHLCEELHAQDRSWEGSLAVHCKNLCQQYPMQRAEIERWYDACRTQFPIYVSYWAKHPDVIKRQPILSERTFCVPIDLPSGRTVRLRGKWDSVDIVGDGVWLQENKSKGDINKQQLERQLTFDNQTMLYLTALIQDTGIEELEVIKQRVGKGATPSERSLSAVRGVRYNVIRRPFSGGKGNIKRKKATKGKKCTKCKGSGKLSKFVSPTDCSSCRGVGRTGAQSEEKLEDFIDRLGACFRSEPEQWFHRWNVTIVPGDIAKYNQEYLIPVLENLCDDWEWWFWCKQHSCSPFVQSDRKSRFLLHCPQHFRLPYGIWNPLTEGRPTEIDEYLATGSVAGLRRVTDLFPELRENPLV